MARRLTEQERENVETLTSLLIEALPPAQRSFSSGIASALVRMSGTTVTEDDLAHILDKYDEADETVAQVVRDTLLDAVEGQDGVYTLRVPQATTAEDAVPEKDAEADADGASGGTDVEGGAPGDEGAMAEAPEDGEAEVGGADEAHPADGQAEPTPDGEAAGGAPAAGEGEPQGDGASTEPVTESAPEQEAPAPKPRRSRRRARRTHKTAEPAQDAQVEDAPNAEAKAPDAKSGVPGGQTSAGTEEDPAEDGGSEAQVASADKGGAKPQDVKPGRGSRSRGAKAEKDPKAQGGKVSQKAERKPAADAGEGAKLSSKPDKAHHKDSSRDLKKVPYVRRGGDAEAETRQKILNLDQRFWLNGWLLSHPAAYTLYERELVAINDALKDGMLPGDITRRQLAYQMGGDEKFFEYGSDGFRLLRAMGMEDVIRHRPMPKPDLVYYAPRRRKHMRVLVTENLDPYLDVHDLMYEDGRTSILGQRIHAVVLGGGTPILEKNRLALLLDTLGADTVTVLYWGDIDRAGLEIMVKLKEVLGDGYKFRAFTPAYQLMVDKASERFPDPADNESTGQVNIEPMDASLLVDGLTDEAAAYARAVIDDCGLIPQEILTRRDL